MKRHNWTGSFNERKCLNCGLLYWPPSGTRRDPMPPCPGAKKGGVE